MLPPAGAGWGSELPCCGHRVCTVEAPRAAAGLRVGREMPPPQGDRSASAGNVGRGDTVKEAGAFRLPQVERKAWKMSRIQVKALRGRRGQAGEKGRASGHPIQDVTRYCVKIHLGNAGDPLGRVSK